MKGKWVAFIKHGYDDLTFEFDNPTDAQQFVDTALDHIVRETDNNGKPMRLLARIEWATEEKED